MYKLGKIMSYCGIFACGISGILYALDIISLSTTIDICIFGAATLCIGGFTMQQPWRKGKPRKEKE